MHSEDMSSKRSNGLAANTPVIVEPLEVLVSSERVPFPLEQVLPEVARPVQCGIAPERNALRRTGDEMLCGHDEDVSSI